MTDAQARAVSAALRGNRLERLKIAAGALVALAKDPDDTPQVFLLGITTGARRLPELLARMAIDEEGAWLLEERPAIDTTHVDYPWLRTLPDGTLGREYVRFIDDNGLDPDLFQPPPGLPPLPTYLTQRIRQSHDLWHVLTGFGTDVPSEVGLQAFTYQQVRIPVSRALVVLGLLRFGLRHPRMLALVRRGRRMGRAAAYLPNVRWERRWEQPLSQVRRELGIAA